MFFDRQVSNSWHVYFPQSQTMLTLGSQKDLANEPGRKDKRQFKL